MAITFKPRPFTAASARLRKTRFASHGGGGGAAPPADSPLKVWDGTAWQPAGVKVTA